jgi:hypothetical protein
MGRIFGRVMNPRNWKDSTIPFNTTDREVADRVEKAINFFVGGSEFTFSYRPIKDEWGQTHIRRQFTITSQGYYHYIGA